jgi:FtsZ-interacting cell division protein ZipA
VLRTRGGVVSALWIALIVLGALLVVAIVVVVVMASRRRALRKQFGAEYDRTVGRAGSRHQAEVDLRDRVDERRHIDVKPLSPVARDRYAEEWRRVQAHFVDAPDLAVREADALVSRMMADRGYPIDDFDHQADLVSVDHPGVVQNYREGHNVYTTSLRNEVSTEDLRHGFICYRALFTELLDDRSEVTG